MKRFFCLDKVLVALLFSITVFLFSPLIIWLKNTKEMHLVWNTPFVFLLYVLGSFLLIITVLNLLPKKISKIVSALLITATVIFFFMGNFLDYKLGVLDGSPINWLKYEKPMLLEIFAIAVSLSLATVFSKEIIFQIKNIFIFLIVFQLIQAGYFMFIDLKDDAFKQDQIQTDYEKILQFSKTDNVLILVLDAYPEYLFEQVLSSKDGNKYREMFKDFTYYPNAMTGFVRTFAAVPFIQSGQLYDGVTTRTKFKEKNKKYFIENVLKDRNTIILHQDLLYQDPNFLMQMVFYKHLPLFIKEKIHKKTLGIMGTYTNYEHPDVAFYKNIDEKINFTDKKVYKYIHLFGVHFPLTMNENIVTDKHATRLMTGKASLKIIRALLDKFDENNAYDNSIIFVIGDHGDAGILKGVEKTKPLFLFKDYRTRQKQIKINTAYVSVGDIPNTIFSRLHKPLNPFGRDISTIKENEDRILKYCSHDWPPAFQDRVENIVCYDVKNAKEILKPVTKKIEKNGEIDLKDRAFYPDAPDHIGPGGLWVAKNARLFFKVDKSKVKNVKVKIYVDKTSSNLKEYFVSIPVNSYAFEIVANFGNNKKTPRVDEFNVPIDFVKPDGEVELEINIEDSRVGNDWSTIGIQISKIMVELN